MQFVAISKEQAKKQKIEIDLESYFQKAKGILGMKDKIHGFDLENLTASIYTQLMKNYPIDPKHITTLRGIYSKAFEGINAGSEEEKAMATMIYVLEEIRGVAKYAKEKGLTNEQFVNAVFISNVRGRGKKGLKGFTESGYNLESYLENTSYGIVSAKSRDFFRKILKTFKDELGVPEITKKPEGITPVTKPIPAVLEVTKKEEATPAVEKSPAVIPEKKEVKEVVQAEEVSKILNELLQKVKEKSLNMGERCGAVSEVAELAIKTEKVMVMSDVYSDLTRIEGKTKKSKKTEELINRLRLETSRILTEIIKREKT